MTTHVRVMYMLDKHVHALNSLIISIITSVFMGYVRVCRLILKKNYKSLSESEKVLPLLISPVVSPSFSHFILCAEVP